MKNKPKTRLTCLIDLFEWNKSTHTLVASYVHLGYNSLTDAPDEILVIGKTKTVKFEKHARAITQHAVTYDPVDILIPYRRLPTTQEWENLILIVRDW
jgi:hypothetical protein